MFPPDVTGEVHPEAAEPHPEGIPALPEPRPAKERLPRHPSPVSPDLRRTLEGGIETLEEARARYACLARALRGPRWQARTSRRLETLRALARQEPRIEEALVRLHQRAQREHWTETEPALGLARKVERLRSRLRGLTCERLGMTAHGESLLVENLAHIEQLLTQTMAAPVSSEEHVLLQGASCFFDPSPWNYVFLLNLFCGIPIWGPARLILLVGWIIMLVRSKNRPLPVIGRWFWLTRKRLVLQYGWRAPIHIPLHAVRPGGVQLLPSRTVRVERVDGRSFHISPRSEDDAKWLIVLLNRHCSTARLGDSHEPVH